MSKNITTEDLRDFLAYVEAHEYLYQKFNVDVVNTVLRSLLEYLETRS